MQTVAQIATRAFFSKSAAAHTEQIAAIRASAPGKVIHLHPKNAVVHECAGVSEFAFEDIDDSDVWLRINAEAGSNSTLILENASRYPRVASSKFKRMQQIAKRVGGVFIIDIVPFTLEPRFLFTTFSYLGTDILGIAKYSAMHEVYEELSADGKVVRIGADPAAMAAKIAPVSSIDYERFTVPREIVPVASTFEEMERYQESKDALFDGEDDAPKIVTKLADLTHAFPSRGNALLALVRTISEPAVIYVNLSSYAARINRALKGAGLTRHKAVSYQMGCDDRTHVAIYMEAPIVNSHFFLDAESRIEEGGRAYHIVSDAKVDTYLFGKLTAELAAIDALTEEMASCRI